MSGYLSTQLNTASKLHAGQCHAIPMDECQAIITLCCVFNDWHLLWEQSSFLSSSYLFRSFNFSFKFCIMNSLEAFNRGRDLPPEALGPPINSFKSEIIPLGVEPSIPISGRYLTVQQFYCLTRMLCLRLKSNTIFAAFLYQQIICCSNPG